MQRIVFFIVFIILQTYVVTKAQLWQSEKNFERNVIIVLGSAKTEIAADRASFYFEVNGFSNDLNSAIKTAREKVDLISKKLFQLGLNENNLTTSQFESSENLGDKAFLSSKRDFRAVIKVQVNIDSISILEPVINTVSLMNPDYISTLSYSLKNIESVKMRTIKDAVEKAKEKANSICESLKINIGIPLYIEEIQNNTNYPNPYNRVVSLQSGVVNEETTQISSIFIENIEIDAAVRVIFAINYN